MADVLYEGKSFNPITNQLPDLPAKQVQEYEEDLIPILDNNYQEQLQQLQIQSNQLQEEITRKTRYQMQTLKSKYWTERRHIEQLRIEPDKKRQKLLELNKKYELAKITAQDKIRPETDSLNMQVQQATMQLQQNYQQRRQAIGIIQDLYEKGIIKDEYAKLKEQYQLVGVDLPVSAFMPERPLTIEQYQKIKFDIDFQVEDLKRQAETASEDERKAIYNRINELEQYQAKVLGLQLPEYDDVVKKSKQLSKVGNQMLAGRKPGTLAEGVWQKKQVKFKGASAGFTFPYTPPKKKKSNKEKIPTPTELRAKGTEEAFNKGVELGYWK